MKNNSIYLYQELKKSIKNNNYNRTIQLLFDSEIIKKCEREDWSIFLDIFNKNSLHIFYEICKKYKEDWYMKMCIKDYYCHLLNNLYDSGYIEFFIKLHIKNFNLKEIGISTHILKDLKKKVRLYKIEKMQKCS